ncbi:COP1-interacting protein 7 isoform X1 [Pistacia vera]|uniref:COP1-interacting protein 7 isoform X1 n=1 Tax=Pistacia vera TaxID=55513 RepID=UPI001263282C|nr:COP1-interacting protein 7 isoform X1 [Pistacia vera]
MDLPTRLDYALFQLTPTRTRFDLVLFFRGNSEKLASGLFEPFISHLKIARDEISKGGYSITLRPPNRDASWFTKATFERFVRFVSTPAVLERFVSLEKEILQIEVSIQANELSNASVPGQVEQGSEDGNIRKSSDSSKLKGELERHNDTEQEENSKIQLQRLLGTRKALLRKEQAMAYARGLVAGFEVDSIDDLISFADTYGASRLREACINFKELCKKKHGDGLWMEELAAMEACSPSELSLLGTSGIVLANETITPNQSVLLNFTSNGNPRPNESLDMSKSDSTASRASSDGKKDDNLPAKVQVPITWPNQLPQYMYGFQGPIQQLPPYQGYPFPPMHPHYAGNMQWQGDYHRNHKSSSRKKENFLNRKGSEHSEEDGQTESSDSDFGSDSDSIIQQEKNSSTEHSYRKKHRTKSSRTVVIRNINYITPKRRNGEKSGGSGESSSDENEFIDQDSFKKVDDAVGLLKKSRKSNSSNKKNRDANKNLHVANGSNDASDQDFDNNSVADVSKRGKGNENWDAFQNLLMRDEDATVNGVERMHSMDVRDEELIVRSSEGGISSATSSAVDPESEKVPKQRIIAADSFVVNEREGGSEHRAKLEGFENEENFRSVLKRGDCTDADLLFSQAPKESSCHFDDIVSAADSSIIKTAKAEDWFVANHSGKPENQQSTREHAIFDGDMSVGDHFQIEKHRKDVLIDDSFMVQSQPATDDLYDSQWRTDISMVAGLTSAANPGNVAANVSQDKHEVCEPDDLCMVLERESKFESVNNSWNVDHGVDVTLEEANRRFSDAEDKRLSSNSEASVVKNNEVDGAKYPGTDAKSKVTRGLIGKTKPELISKSRKPFVSRPAVQKSTLEKEEEIRKKMEELAIQRQKRIAERTAASGLAPVVCKKVPLQSKTTKGSITADKNRTRSAAQETNKIVSSRIGAS